MMRIGGSLSYAGLPTIFLARKPLVSAKTGHQFFYFCLVAMCSRSDSHRLVDTAV